MAGFCVFSEFLCRGDGQSGSAQRSPKPPFVGSNPTTPAKFKSHRDGTDVQIVAMATLGTLHWSVKPVLVGSTPTRHPKFDVVGIVQRSERRPVTPNVVGSNPTVHPKFQERVTTEMVEGGVQILNSEDGSSPSVQRRTGLVAPSGQDWPEVHIELPSSKGKFARIAQLDLERIPPKDEVAGSSPATSTTLAATVGSPLDHECPACKAPKGVPCRSATTHYDRVVLIRVLHV